MCKANIHTWVMSWNEACINFHYIGCNCCVHCWFIDRGSALLSRDCHTLCNIVGLVIDLSVSYLTMTYFVELKNLYAFNKWQENQYTYFWHVFNYITKALSEKTLLTLLINRMPCRPLSHSLSGTQAIFWSLMWLPSSMWLRPAECAGCHDISIIIIHNPHGLWEPNWLLWRA